MATLHHEPVLKQLRASAGPRHAFSPAAGCRPSHGARKPTTDVVLVVFHWACVAALVLNLLTGLRIAADDAGATVTRWLAVMALEGDVHLLHYGAGLSLAAVAAGYAAYLKLRHLGGRFRLSRERARVAVQGGGRQAWRARNLLIYLWLFALIGFQALSGTVLYLDWPMPLALSADRVADAHTIAALLLLASVTLHILAQYQYGAAGPNRGWARARTGLDWLLKMLRPRLPVRRDVIVEANLSATALAFAMAAAAGGGLFALDRESYPTLVVRELGSAAAPVLDGRGDDPAWSEAGHVTVLTHDGVNLPHGQSLVTIRALRDRDSIYLSFIWQDPTRSLQHLPLQKTARGWMLLHEQYDVEDEDRFYEDKFAVLLSRSPEPGAGGTAHLGPHPLRDKPPAFSGRGLHYTTDGSIADLWHWKAVRTGASGTLGWADDDYFGPPAAAKPEELAGRSRYKAGYVTDPGTAGYFNNFDHEGPGGYGQPIRPLRLPLDWRALKVQLGRIDLDPEHSEEAPWLMAEEESAAYTPDLDASIPVGTVIPGVLIANDGALTGDRGDVRCAGDWAGGLWTLECRRRLDTGNPYDIALRPGEPVYLWVSVFDHTQTRHSRHMRPIRLLLPQAHGETAIEG
jgi:hypothetical protein